MLEQKKIKEYNALIAEFIGYTYYGWNDPNHRALDWKTGYWGHKNNPTHCLKIVGSIVVNPLTYHWSWDALIPVVKTAKKTVGDFEPHSKAEMIAKWLYDQIEKSLCELDILSTYKVLILYIKHYNSNKKQKL